jgi:hypothetical protein
MSSATIRHDFPDSSPAQLVPARSHIVYRRGIAQDGSQLALAGDRVGGRSDGEPDDPVGESRPDCRVVTDGTGDRRLAHAAQSHQAHDARPAPRSRREEVPAASSRSGRSTCCWDGNGTSGSAGPAQAPGHHRADARHEPPVRLIVVRSEEEIELPVVRPDLLRGNPDAGIRERARRPGLSGGRPAEGRQAMSLVSTHRSLRRPRLAKHLHPNRTTGCRTARDATVQKRRDRACPSLREIGLSSRCGPSGHLSLRDR